MMVTLLSSLFKALETGLRIWDHKEKTKYQEQISELKLRISNEEAKDLSERDQNVIDRAHRDLMLIIDKWTLEVAGPDSPDKS